MLTITFIAVVAWSTFVLTTAIEYGRQPNRLQRVARVFAIAGVVLVVPVLVLGSYGLPNGWSFHWLWAAAELGYIGLTLAVGGACAWLVADTVFVWLQRRRVFPFAFRGTPGGEG